MSGRRREAAGVSIELRRRVRAWSPARSDLARWASMAAGRAARGRELGVAVVGAAESRRLNARFRGRNSPTNVLSFAAGEAPHPGAASLGELVICPRVLLEEARAYEKTLEAHWAHLIVHGTLHLLGYDHAGTRDAQRMERREISVLKRLGFANPYRSR